MAINAAQLDNSALYSQVYNHQHYNYSIKLLLQQSNSLLLPVRMTLLPLPNTAGCNKAMTTLITPVDSLCDDSCVFQMAVKGHKPITAKER